VGGTCGAIGGGGSATWGGIGGTLANQTDLAAALTAKLNASSFTQAAAAALWTGSGCGTGTNALLVNGNCGASGGGSAVMASQLLDFAVTVTSIAVETMCASCSSTTPGILYVGVVPFIATVPVTVGISGTVTSGTVYWYLSSLQVLTAGHNSAATLTGSAGIAVATGVTGFPVDSVPLWVSTFAANNWDSTNEGTMDKRPFLGRTVIAVGREWRPAAIRRRGCRRFRRIRLRAPASLPAPERLRETARPGVISTRARSLICTGAARRTPGRW